MTNLRNELPVAVHLASGGDARVRTGGQTFSFNGVSSGSFQMTGATRFRAFFSTRTMSGLLLLLSYTNPVTLLNASWIMRDLTSLSENVPEGATVYFAAVSPDDFTAMQGGEFDTLHVSFYG
jgi:hypothetical protein